MGLYDAEEFPWLRTAAAQNALVSLVERQGHSALISELVTHDATIEQTLNGVFRAFLDMVDLQHATVQEVIPLFTPEDFKTRKWEHVTTMPVITEESATETITEATQVHIQGSYIAYYECPCDPLSLHVPLVLKYLVFPFFFIPQQHY
ncbi:hypothetical protein AAG570_004419 [Ranatra chinensis]|uniref:Uncharacterized protein n=1 Tax=Ranatra chinensis TaxID=642074 RepID=A0ABD0Y0U2_9HEMI